MPRRMEDAGPEDIIVVQRVLRGDAEEFRHIVRRYGGRLRRYLTARLGNAEEADDAAQDVLLRAYRSLGRFKVGMAFAPWLFAIAANCARTQRLRWARQNERERPLGNGEEAYGRGDTEQEALDSIARREVRTAVAGLSRRYRAAVELYYFACLSIEETATALGLGTEAVKTRLLRARRMLAGAVSDQGRAGQASAGAPKARQVRSRRPEAPQRKEASGGIQQ